MGRIVGDMIDQVMSHVAEPAAATASAQRRIEAEIRQTLVERPSLHDRYERLVQLQSEIDARKARHEPIPAAWISNPVLLAYYKSTGMLVQ